MGQISIGTSNRMLAQVMSPRTPAPWLDGLPPFYYHDDK